MGHEPLGREQALVLDVRVRVRHELHDARLGAELLDRPVVSFATGS